MKKRYSLVYYPSCCSKREKGVKCSCKQVQNTHYEHTLKEILHSQKLVGGRIFDGDKEIKI